MSIQSQIQTKFQISSQSIQSNKEIDISYTKYGSNQVPDISWSGVPESTRELLLICFDPDALPIAKKVWVHWLVSNIDPSTLKLEDGKHVVQRNDFYNKKHDGKAYDGPAPPVGTGTHHYHYKLYALDQELNLDSDKKYLYTDVMDAIKDHVIDETEIVGTYEKV
jgi:Raf kinase inhibitor-like YbhB/YbcL family protein